MVSPADGLVLSSSASPPSRPDLWQSLRQVTANSWN